MDSSGHKSICLKNKVFMAAISNLSRRTIKDRAWCLLDLDPAYQKTYTKAILNKIMDL